MSNETTDFFDGIGSGNGVPSAVLKGVGDFVHGEILEMFKRDYIPYGKKEAEKNEDGSTRQQLVIVVQTPHRNWANVVKVPKVDPSDPNSPEKSTDEDDGKRAVYVPERSNIQFAIGRAVTAAAPAKFSVGGTLGVKIENLKDTGKGNPLKEHAAVYTAKPAATADEFFGKSEAPASSPAPEASAPAQESMPVQQDPWATSSTSSEEPPF